MGTETDSVEIRVGVAAPEARVLDKRHGPTEAQLAAFCSALSMATGVKVVAHGVAHYKDLLYALQKGQLQLAWLPPVIALHAAVRGNTVPIALPVRSGAAFYSAALFTSVDSSIQVLGDLPGVRAAWVDRQSAAGYLFIRASLRLRGVDVNNLFGSEQFCGSHQAVVQAVLGGAADVGATYAHLDPRRSAPTRAGWGQAKVRILATAGPIPGDVIAATIRMPVSTIRLVQKALVHPPHEAMKRTANELFNADEFVEATSEHLDPLVHLLGHLDDN